VENEEVFDFDSEYPILNEAIEAFSGALPTVSILAEQVHGSLRAQLNKEHGSDLQEMISKTKSNVKHWDKEVLRDELRRQITKDIGEGALDGAQDKKKTYKKQKLYNKRGNLVILRECSLKRARTDYTENKMSGVPSVRHFKNTVGTMQRHKKSLKK